MKLLAHFGLKHLPFHKGGTILWDNKSLIELERKFKRLLELPGVGVLTGEYGLGKTMAVKKIVGEINPHMYHVTYIAETGFSRSEFYRILVRKLGVELAYRRSDLWFNIREKLVDMKTNRKILPIIIIDEAQSLHSEFFIDLSSFLNFNFDSEDIFTLWLVGNKNFLQKIKQIKYESLMSRIRIYHDLRQIEDFEEFKSFIKLGFNEAGCTTTLLSDSSIRVLKEATKSAPRRIYNVVTNCLEAAYEKNLTHIPDELLEEIICNMM